MMMGGVACVLICCVLFIHLGMGETICNIIKRDVTLLQCTKCLTFWSVLCYSLFHTDVLTSITTAFVTAYIALWAELLLDKARKWYETQW